MSPEPTQAVWDLAVLVESDGIGIIRGTVDYPGHASYVNLWEVHLAADGRATRFVEWYLTVPADIGDGVGAGAVIA